MDGPESLRRDELGNKAICWIRNSDEFAASILDLICALGVQAYVVGGAVRDYFLGTNPTDLDVIIPNDDETLTIALSRLYPSRVNRHGNKRYCAGGRNVDVIRPKYFYKNFSTAEEAISYFDISVNALGVRLHDGLLIEPWNGVADIAKRQVRSIQKRWQEANDFEFVHLMLRLLRYVERYQLRFLEPEIIANGIHRLHSVPWDDIARLHALTKHEAIERLKYLAVGGGDTQTAK